MATGTSPARTSLNYRLGGAAADVMFSSLLGWLLVRDTRLLPPAELGPVLVFVGMLAPAVAAHIFGRGKGVSAPAGKANLILGATLLVALVGAYMDIAPTVASGALAVRLAVVSRKTRQFSASMQAWKLAANQVFSTRRQVDGRALHGPSPS